MLLTCCVATRPPVPIAVYKESSVLGTDACIPIMNLQTGQLVWNMRLARSEAVFVQRYIYNGSPCAFILRATYQPTLSNFTYTIYQNTVPVAKRKDQFSKSLRFAFNERRPTIRHKDTYVIQVETDQEDLTPADRYCVSTATPTAYEVADWHEIDSVKTQLVALKVTLEKGYLCAFNLELLELVADFCQDRDKKWYFVTLRSYKTVLIVKKKITSGSLDRLLVRLMSPVRPKSAITHSKTHKKRVKRRTKRAMTFTESELSQTLAVDTLVKDVLRDLKPHSKRR